MPWTSWTLSPQAHAVEHDGDLVVLDVSSDSYFCLSGERAAVSLTGGEPRMIEISDPAIAEALLGVGLIMPRETARASAGETGAVFTCGGAPSPAVSAVRLAYPPPDWRDVAMGLIGLLDLLRGYWRRPFAEILRRGLAGRPPVADTPSAELLAAVEAFHRWSPYAPVPAKCLVRAFLLLRWLARRGHGAHWVFGVTTWPFRAHCWLQCGEVALDEDVERLAAYSVIMVL